MIHSEHACQRFWPGSGNPVTFDCVAWPVGYIVSLYNFGVGALQVGIRAVLQPKQLMLWRDLGGRTKEEHQELQNLDPTSSPHLEEILFGGEVDLDLLSCFPKFGQES